MPGIWRVVAGESVSNLTLDRSVCDPCNPRSGSKCHSTMSNQEESVRVRKWFDFRSKNGYTAEERKDLRRSLVRVWVTYVAALYLFILGPVAAWMVLGAKTVNVAAGDNGTLAVLAPNVAAGKDLFLSILPIATGIVTYWFAARGNEPTKKSDG